MNAKYPKNEKLKSRKLIDTLFTEAKSVGVYPLRAVYSANVIGENPEPLQIGVSVSKKYFKKATDRNYFKRVLRETYRQNKEILKTGLPKPYAIMLFYQSKDRLSYEEINQKTILLFEKLISKIHGQSHT